MYKTTNAFHTHQYMSQNVQVISSFFKSSIPDNCTVTILYHYLYLVLAAISGVAILVLNITAAWMKNIIRCP